MPYRLFHSFYNLTDASRLNNLLSLPKMPNESIDHVPILLVTGRDPNNPNDPNRNDMVAPYDSQHVPFYKKLDSNVKREILYPCGHTFLGYWSDENTPGIDDEIFAFFD